MTSHLSKENSLSHQLAINQPTVKPSISHQRIGDRVVDSVHPPSAMQVSVGAGLLAQDWMLGAVPGWMGGRTAVDLGTAGLILKFSS